MDSTDSGLFFWVTLEWVKMTRFSFLTRVARDGDDDDGSGGDNDKINE
ncbi:hypothetical protein A2U01_0079342, partial [Trifolium medium]|nr:hypothetical protein [Trifolium medium]